jgi:anti-sigma regulatory factor (Ser/Thr protein kinase)
VLLSSNGNDLHSYVIDLFESSQVGEARRFIQLLCTSLNFDETRKGRASIIVNELGNNLVRYARGGRMIFRRIEDIGVEIISMDNGPGLDVSMVMTDGFTTGATPGTGLGAVKRQADEFDIYSSTGSGTIIVSILFCSEESHAKMRRALYQIGAINVPVRGEVVSGDAWASSVDEDEVNLIVSDGLGHGPLANQASLDAISVFTNSPSKTPDQLLQSIHGRLKSTRGAAVFLLRIKPTTIDYTAVGNVRVFVDSQGKSKSLISHNGTAGLQIRSSRQLSQDWDHVGGCIIAHTDGITSSADLAKYPGIRSRHPSIIAAALFRDFYRGNDDATVVVLRKTP